MLAHSMMLANYLGRKGRATGLKGVVLFSAGWDVFECTASLEKPLDRFIFNSYLTSCLQASVDRSVVEEVEVVMEVVMEVVVTVVVVVTSDASNALLSNVLL